MTMARAEPWQHQFKKVDQRYDYLLTSEKWTDCTFMVGSEPFKVEMPAHKLILAAASPVFETRFYGWQSEENQRMIPIPDVQPEAFRALLQYIYTGHLEIDSFDMAWKLWHVAKKYELLHLVKECNIYICSVVSPRNVWQSYKSAHFYNETAIMDKCIEIISTKTKEVLNESSFEEIELDTLVTVLSLDHLNVDSELDLIRAVARYAEAGKKRQKPFRPSMDSEPPTEKLSELRLEPTSSEEKVLNGESNFPTSPAVELDSKPPTEVVTAKPTADKQNFEEELERSAPAGIRAAIEKLRFLTLTPEQFAGCPALSLLTGAEAYAIIMNISAKDSELMPTGFSECRDQRQRIDVVNETPNADAASRFITPTQIVQGIASIDINTSKEAARAARDFLSKDTTTQLTRSQLVEAGAIPPLVDALFRTCHDLQLHAAGALAIIASGTPEHTLAVVDEGAIPKLIALLGYGGELSAQSASVLGAIAEDGPVNRDTVLKLGALPAMLPYMNRNTPFEQLRSYVWTYSNMCWHDNPIVSFELVSPALSCIPNLLALSDEEILADTCLALSSLTDGPNERIESIQAIPLLTKRLIALLGHSAPRVQTPALRALGNMLTGTKVQIDRCLNAGCLDHIINFLKCDATARVKEAAWAASNILGGTHTQIQKALDKGILEPLRKVLAEGDVKCKEEAAWAITNLCLGGTTDQLGLLRSSGVLEPYCRLLSSPDHSTVLLILDGLSSVLQFENKVGYGSTLFGQTTVLKQFGVPQLLITLQQHEHYQIRLEASHLSSLITSPFSPFS